MESQSYYQNLREDAPQPGPVGGLATPSPLRWIWIAMAVLLLLTIALPLVMTIDQASVVRTIVHKDPSLSGDALGFAIAMVLTYTWVLHAVYAGATTLFTVTALRGRQWARIATTATMTVATAGSLNSVAAGSEYLWAVIPSDVLQVAIVALLWVPRSSRAFFTAHRRTRAADRHGHPQSGG